MGLTEGKFPGTSYITADVNVLSFGAVGDGVTDDTGAFRKAIAEANKKGGGTVYVPAGFY